MGSRIATTPQGFLVHDRRIEVGAITAQGTGATAQSTYTQAGPRPGTAIAADTCTKVRPQIHGAQSNTLDLIVQRGGNLGATRGAGWCYRKDGDTAAQWRSWNLPNVLAHMQILELETSGAGSIYDDAALVVLPKSQKVVAIAFDRNPAGVGLPDNTFAWVFTPSTRTWGAKVTIGRTAGGADVNARGRIAATYIEDACRILVVSCPLSRGGQVWSSDDEGATWSAYAANVYDVQPDITGQPALEQDRYGNLLLITADGTDVLSYYSEDQGHTFVQSLDSGLAWSAPTMCRTASGDILVGYIRGGAAYCRRITSAFEAPNANTEITIRGSGGANECALMLDPSGQVWAFVRDNTPGAIVCYRSSDDGATWTETGKLWNPYNPGATGDPHVSNLRVVACCGEALLVGNPLIPTSTTSGTIMALQAGGWDSIEHDPEYSSTSQQWYDRIGWGDPGVSSGAGGITWHSLELPGNSGWTQTGTAPTFSADGWLFSTAAASSYATYSWTYSQPALGWIFEFQVNSGGSLTATDCGVELQRQDGSSQTRLALRATTTGVRVYDVEAASALATVTVDTTSHLQWLVVYDAVDSVTAWYRDPASSTWTEAGAFTLGTSATAGTTDLCRVGHVNSGTAESAWRWLAFSSEKVVNHTLVATSDYGAFAWGKNIDSRPYPIRDEGDASYRARVSGSGGPARYGDSFEIVPRYDYGLELIHPQIAPSPRRAWRSTAAGTTIDIVWDLGEDTRFQPGWLLGVTFVGQTIPRTIQVSTMEDGGSSFTARGTYDGATGFTSLTYALAGNLLSPGTSTATAGRYVRENEFVGGYVILDPSGTPKARKIVSNTAGWWAYSASDTIVKPVFRLDGIDGTESSTGAVNIIHPGGVLLCPFTSESAFRYVRLRIPSATGVPDSYFTLGSVCLGAVMIPGHRVSRGWSMRWAPNVRSETDDYGTTFVRKRGPVRRQLTFSYQDLIDELRHLGRTSPDYVAPGSSTPAESTAHDVAGRLAGLLHESKGGELPVTALWSIPDGNSAVTITDPSLWLYGVLQGTLQANHVIGTAGTDAVHRIESLTITELPWDTD